MRTGWRLQQSTKPYAITSQLAEEEFRFWTISPGATQKKPERLGSLVRACEACYDFAVAFKAPFISGKDSLYNESPLGPVTPTLLITAVGVIPNIQSTTSMDLKAAGNLLYIIGETFNELGGSEYYKLKGFLGASVPKVRGAKAKRTFKVVTKAIDEGLVKSCHDLSEGGLAVAAAEMAFAGGYGLEIDLRKGFRERVNPKRFRFVL